MRDSAGMRPCWVAASVLAEEEGAVLRQMEAGAAGGRLRVIVKWRPAGRRQAKGLVLSSSRGDSVSILLLHSSSLLLPEEVDMLIGWLTISAGGVGPISWAADVLHVQPSHGNRPSKLCCTCRLAVLGHQPAGGAAQIMTDCAVELVPAQISLSAG